MYCGCKMKIENISAYLLILQFATATMDETRSCPTHLKETFYQDEKTMAEYTFNVTIDLEFTGFGSFKAHLLSSSSQLNFQRELSGSLTMLQSTDALPRCKKSDPKIEECLLNIIEIIRPRLKLGIPEFNIPALDPFYLPMLNVDNSLSNVELRGTIHNVVLYGVLSFVIQDLQVDFTNQYEAKIKVVLPEIFVTGNYDVYNLKLLFFDLSSKGRFAGKLRNIKATIKSFGNVFEKNGEKYLHIENIETKLEVGDAHVDVYDSNRSILVEAAAAAFNHDPSLFLDEVIPIIEDTASLRIKENLNKLLENIALKEIFEDAQDIIL